MATPFDVKNGRGQVPGVSSVGPTTGHNGSAMVSDGETYNIKFTFAASPLSKTVSAPVSARLSAHLPARSSACLAQRQAWLGLVHFNVLAD